MAPGKRLFRITEHKDEDFLSKRWENFDHSQKISLGVLGSTWTVLDKTTAERFVLQSCAENEWSRPRYLLLQLSRQRSDLFVPPQYLFFQRNQVYVCSEVGGLSLAEIANGTVPMTELHAAVILTQVIKILQVAWENNIYYGVKASNVFLMQADQKTVAIRLAGFGSRLQPTEMDNQADCRDVGNLAYHMLTGIPKVASGEECLRVHKMISIRTKTIEIPVNADQQLSSAFFDFIEACIDRSCRLEALLKHKFLKTRSAVALGPLLRHVERTSLIGHQWSEIDKMDYNTED